MERNGKHYNIPVRKHRKTVNAEMCKLVKSNPGYNIYNIVFLFFLIPCSQYKPKTVAPVKSLENRHKGQKVPIANRNKIQEYRNQDKISEMRAETMCPSYYVLINQFSNLLSAVVAFIAVFLRHRVPVGA